MKKRRNTEKTGAEKVPSVHLETFERFKGFTEVFGVQYFFSQDFIEEKRLETLIHVLTQYPSSLFKPK